MSKTRYAMFMYAIVAYCLLIAGCVPDASAQSVLHQPPRYEQPWRAQWQHVPRWRHRERRRAWRREVRRVWRGQSVDDHGRRWHGYRSE